MSAALSLLARAATLRAPLRRPHFLAPLRSPMRLPHASHGALPRLRSSFSTKPAPQSMQAAGKLAEASSAVRPQHPLDAQTSQSQKSHYAVVDKVVTFNDHRTAYSHLSSLEIIRALFIFRLCSYETLVRNAEAIMNLFRKVVGRRLTYWMIKKSFFPQFCAGTSVDDLRPRVETLKRHGVLPIFDYAAESDDATSVPEQTGRATKEDLSEEDCDNDAEIVRRCIVAAGQFEDGFAALKITALARPQLLRRYSEILRAIRRLFAQFDPDQTGLITWNQFNHALDYLGLYVNSRGQPQEAERRELFQIVDRRHAGAIDWLEWSEYLDVDKLATRPLFTQATYRISPADGPVLPSLRPDELRQSIRLSERLDTLAKCATEHKVRLMVDAEQSYFQPAIQQMVVKMQRKYNRSFPAIFNTYQSYLKDSTALIEEDLLRARREGFLFAGKLVRGAYIALERGRALRLGYEDPIWPNIEKTHECFHRNLDAVLDQMDIANVMVATHNTKSVEFTCQHMKEKGIPKKGGGVFFGQLLGMSDHVSFTLGAQGYQVYKYLPYGPVDAVVPYLLRRIEENSSLITGGATQAERHLLWKELKRRFAAFFHRPKMSSNQS